MTFHIWRCFILSRVNFKIGTYKLLEGEIILRIHAGEWLICLCVDSGLRMLLDFFVWDNCVKKARNIYRSRHTVAGRRLLVRMFSGFSEIDVFYFENFTPFWATY